MKRSWFDRVTERLTRHTAQVTSRRGFLGTLGLVATGTAALTLLPIYRSGAFAQAGANETGDPNTCEYWRHCAIDGFLCGCCGGSSSSCPPGTVASDVTWIGTCLNPTDGRNYVIAYNDCCGAENCGRCICQRDEGNTPVYRPQTSNNVNWCAASQANVPYTCSLAVVIGVQG